MSARFQRAVAPRVALVVTALCCACGTGIVVAPPLAAAAVTSSTSSTPASSQIPGGNSDTDEVTVTGNTAGGSPTGTVTFYQCGPTASPESCTSQTNEVGSAANLSAGPDDTATAISAPFTPNGTGYWCFAAYYSGSETYGASSDTSTDGCFDVTTPVVPLVDCVQTNPTTGFVTAYFGYNNTGSVQYFIPLGSANTVTPGTPFQGQPETFNVGNYPMVFKAVYDPTLFDSVMWLLNGYTASASTSSPQCSLGATSPASDITASSATLNGVVTPGGEDVGYSFQYGTSPSSLDASTPSEDAGSGTVPELVQAPLTDLEPSTTYYYNLETTSPAFGTTEGQVLSFTTPASGGTPVPIPVTPPPAPATPPSGIPVVPFPDCVETNPTTGFVTAYFGYNNTGSVQYFIPLGSANTVTPGTPFQGQPETFNVGNYPMVFNAIYDPTLFDSVMWLLNGYTASAAASFPQCSLGATSPASDITASSATLNGVVTPGGENVDYSFQYGTSPSSLDATTPSEDTGSGTVPELVQAPLADLEPNTTYYYSLETTSAEFGTTHGQVLSFTTPAEPQTITFNPPSSALFGSTTVLTATGGGSGNPVVFSLAPSSSPGACYLSGTDNATVTFTGAGDCVIDANQAGNADYSPAPQVTATIEVTYSEPCISSYHSLTVRSGEAVCLSPRADIDGSITVDQGGSLDIEGAMINGSVTAKGAGVVKMCGSKLNGSLSVSSSTGPVIVGDEEGSPCGGNTVDGPASLTSNSAGVEFDYDTVYGPLTVTGNTGSVPPPGSGPVATDDDSVTGLQDIQ
jgi:hypothetical protein